MEFADLTPQLYLILFAVALLAGFLDTLVGGGGLLTTPALILSGMSPLMALGTNKLQSTMGTATAAYMVISKRKVSWQEIRWLMLSAFIGSVLGTLALQLIDAATLSFVIPVVLFFIGSYFLFSPKVREEDCQPRISERLYRMFVVPLVGWYDGMFGPGTGSFFALAGVSLRGYGLVSSTAQAKPLNFSTNIASLIVFLFAGQFVWQVGVLMMLGQFIGARFGANVLFSIRISILKPMIVLMCFGMLISYVYKMGWLAF